MSEETQVPMPPALVEQLALGHVLQEARANLAFDVPRQWATIITMTVDDTNGTIILTFREGINLTLQGDEGVESVQQVNRNVASLVLPRRVVTDFLKGAAEYLASQETPTNGR